MADYSTAAKNRWKKVPKSERSKRASHAATAKQAQMTTKDKRKHALKMVKARVTKQKK